MPLPQTPPARDPRPLAAMCSATLVAVEQPADAKTSGGRWRLNAGGEMVLVVQGLNQVETEWGLMSQPIRAVIDLASAQFDGPRVRALVDHWQAMFAVAGWWINGAVTPTGIEASLEWFVPKSAAAQEAASHIALARELVEAGDPMEASVGVQPQDNVIGAEGWELIPAGMTVELNGRTFSGDGEYPLYALRNGRIFEASLVLWGADRDTGRLAASRLHAAQPKERPMLDHTRLAALGTKYKGFESVVLATLASGPDVTDDAVAQAVLTAQNAALAAEVAALKAAQTKPAPAAPAAPGPAALAARANGEAAAPPAAGAGAGDADTPADVPAAMRQLTADGSKLTGFALRVAALSRWPELRATVPNAIPAKA